MFLEWLIPAAQAQARGGEGQGAWLQFVFIGLLFVLFYFMLIRPQRKRQKEHQLMINALQKGDEVVTNGGIMGKITRIQEDSLYLLVAQKVEIRLQKQAVQAVLPQGTLKTS